MIISPKAENNAQKTHRNKLAEKSGSSDFVKAPAPCTRKDIAAARYFIGIEHILDENTVSARRIRYKNMRYGADKLSVLG